MHTNVLINFKKHSYSTKRFLGLDQLALIVLDHLLQNEKKYKNYFHDNINNESIEDLIKKLAIDRKKLI